MRKTGHALKNTTSFNHDMGNVMAWACMDVSGMCADRSSRMIQGYTRYIYIDSAKYCKAVMVQMDYDSKHTVSIKTSTIPAKSAV